MTDESQQLGSNCHKQVSIEKFEEQFEKMTSLMQRARSVEFRLRMLYEAREHREFAQFAEFERFVNSNFQVDRRKFNRLLSALVPNDKNERFQEIREILDALAHADYFRSRMLTQKYNQKWDAGFTLSNEPYPERFIEGLRNEKGKAVTYARLIESSEKNLIPEEFAVFEHQGYVTACDQLINEVNSFFRDNKVLGWIYELLSMQRVYQFGIKNDA